MRRITMIVPTLALLSLVSSTAFACAPTDGELWVLALIAAPFLAVPYAAFGSLVAAAQAKSWFGSRRLRGWFFSTVGAYVAATAGAVAGIGIAFPIAETFEGNTDLLTVIVLSTPFVFEVAYLMWLHARRRSN